MILPAHAFSHEVPLAPHVKGLQVIEVQFLSLLWQSTFRKHIAGPAYRRSFVVSERCRWCRWHHMQSRHCIVPEAIPILSCGSVRYLTVDDIWLPRYVKSCTPFAVGPSTTTSAGQAPAPMFRSQSLFNRYLVLGRSTDHLVCLKILKDNQNLFCIVRELPRRHIPSPNSISFNVYCLFSSFLWFNSYSLQLHLLFCFIAHCLVVCTYLWYLPLPVILFCFFHLSSLIVNKVSIYNLKCNFLVGHLTPFHHNCSLGEFLAALLPPSIFSVEFKTYMKHSLNLSFNSTEEWRTQSRSNFVG